MTGRALKMLGAVIALFLIGLGAYSLWGGAKSTGIDQVLLEQISEVWPR